MFPVKNVEAYQDLPGEESVESSAERFGIIRGYRTIGLLESLESLELYYPRERRLTKDKYGL